MSTTVSLALAKARLPSIVGSVEATHDRVVITRAGEPAAVLVSLDDLAALEETIEILSDGTAVAELVQARSEIDAKTTNELSELRRG